jgi:hypothetical protein
MNNRIKERIEIARRYKPVYANLWKGITPEKRDKRLQQTAIIGYNLVSVLLVVLIFVSIIALLNIESISDNWANAGLLVLMTMALSSRGPISYIELMLKDHINRIENIEMEFDPALNLELEKKVEQLNQRRKTRYLIGIPLFIIFSGAFLQLFDANPYWNHFPPYVLAVSIYLLVRLSNDVRTLKKSINNIEAFN